MKNTQKIINDTIVDHDGHKRFTQMILGDPENGYVQGTILDANAVAEVAGLNNINAHQISGKHTLAEAIDLVNEQDREIGTIISYTTNTDEEVLKQFVGTSLAQWDIENAWVDYDKDAKPKDVCSTIYVDQSYVTKGVRPWNKFILVPTIEVTYEGYDGEYLIVFVDGRFWYFFSPEIDDDKSLSGVFIVRYRTSPEIVSTGYAGLESTEENGARTFFESKNIHCYGGVLRGIMNNEHLTFNIVNDYHSYTIDEIMQNSVSLDECAWEDMDPNTSGDTQIRIYGDVAANRDDEGNLIYEQKETSDGIKTVVSTKSYLENAVSNLRKNTKRVVLKTDDDSWANGFEDVTRFYPNTDSEDDMSIFIQLPKFWWKCTETNVRDLFKLEIVTDAKYIDASFKEWSGDTYIARYKVSLFDPSGKLEINNGIAVHDTFDPSNSVQMQSIPNYPTTNLSYNDYKAIIDNSYADLPEAAKLSMIKYNSHKIMAMLFMAYYGDNDIQAVCGSGKNWVDNHPVMQEDGTYRLEYDTIASENPDNVWFWGLCDWAGNVIELVEDMNTITDLESSPAGEVVGTNAYSYRNGCIGLSNAEQNITEIVDGVQSETDEPVTHLILGNNFELLPAAGAVLVDYHKYDDAPWKDFINVTSDSGRIAYRSGSRSDNDNGLFNLSVNMIPDHYYQWSGSRLEYIGPTVKKY